MHDLSYIIKANKEEAARQLREKRKRQAGAIERIERANKQKSRILSGSRGR